MECSGDAVISYGMQYQVLLKHDLFDIDDKIVN